MQIVPVIDLKDGLVVHAVRGNRIDYRPIHTFSSLIKHSSLEAVMESFLSLYAFKQFYIADLNAITGTGSHQTLIESLLKNHPELDFWVDNGSQLTDLSSRLPNQTWIIGTESQQTYTAPASKDFILSLDYQDHQQIGDSDWFNNSQYWPDQIIIMTLNRVGSNNGPDFDKLRPFIQQHPDKQFIAAGGIRNSIDLNDLQKLGVHAALVSTALHNGGINPQSLQNL
ncbi:MAG: histidine biosynthesis protein [Methylomonas sp.]|nr:MAG: histidine biosynthesis protein [Methylomonas sp.]